MKDDASVLEKNLEAALKKRLGIREFKDFVEDSKVTDCGSLYFCIEALALVPGEYASNEAYKNYTSTVSIGEDCVLELGEGHPNEGGCLATMAATLGIACVPLPLGSQI